MLLLQYIIVILHIATAAAFFGLALPLGRYARALAQNPSVAFADQGQKTVRVMTVLIVLTAVFGLTAFFLGGGFGAYGPEFHTSILLIILLIGVQIFLIQGSWGKLRDAVAAGGDVESPRKRVAMGVGIAQLLWFVLLVLMFWRYLYAGFAQL